jgi:hypothetical protein
VCLCLCCGKVKVSQSQSQLGYPTDEYHNPIHPSQVAVALGRRSCDSAYIVLDSIRLHSCAGSVVCPQFRMGGGVTSVTGASASLLLSVLGLAVVPVWSSASASASASLSSSSGPVFSVLSGASCQVSLPRCTHLACRRAGFAFLVTLVTFVVVLSALHLSSHRTTTAHPSYPTSHLERTPLFRCQTVVSVSLAVKLSGIHGARFLSKGASPNRWTPPCLPRTLNGRLNLWTPPQSCTPTMHTTAPPHPHAHTR